MSKQNLVVIGASTGGPQTVKRVFSKLPVLNASIILVQHMPKYVNASFVKSMKRVANMEIKLISDGMPLEKGVVLVAPSEVHTEIIHNGIAKLVHGDKVNFVRPAIDVTMKSLVSGSKTNIIGVILTGMGSDGAEGLAYIKDVGGTTLAQDEASSIIYGMPKVAAATGKVDFILSPEAIADKITELVQRK